MAAKTKVYLLVSIISYRMWVTILYSLSLNTKYLFIHLNLGKLWRGVIFMECLVQNKTAQAFLRWLCCYWNGFASPLSIRAVRGLLPRALLDERLWTAPGGHSCPTGSGQQPIIYCVDVIYIEVGLQGVRIIKIKLITPRNHWLDEMRSIFLKLKNTYNPPPSHQRFEQR